MKDAPHHIIWDFLFCFWILHFIALVKTYKFNISTIYIYLCVTTQLQMICLHSLRQPAWTRCLGWPLYEFLARYVKLWVMHAQGMRVTLFPPPRVSDPDMHDGRCVTQVSWCIPGSPASDFLWSRWQGKRCRHSRRMHVQRQFYVSGKRPTGLLCSTNLFCRHVSGFMTGCPYGVSCRSLTFFIPVSRSNLWPFFSKSVGL